MKVALDISALDPTFKEHAQRGIGRYVGELKKYFDSASLERGDSVSYFHHRDVGGKFGQLISRSIDYLPAGKATLKQQLVLPFLYRSLRESRLLHFPAHMDAPARGMPPYVLTVLDLIPQVLSDLYRADKPDWRFRLARSLENQSIRNAELLLCISECTARDVNRVLGVPWEKLRVTHLGVDEKFFKSNIPDNREDFLRKLSLPVDCPLILYVGGIDPRKNWQFALNVIKELDQRSQISAKPSPVLVMAGRIEKDREFPKLTAMIAKLGLQQRVQLLGFVPDEDLLQLYSVSSAFFFPSLYEGFGLPPLEAMAAGLPVVSSNASCMPEILGDGAILVDPDDVSSAAEALVSLCQTASNSATLKERGQMQARRFTWANTGAKTLKCYQEAHAAIQAK